MRPGANPVSIGFFKGSFKYLMYKNSAGVPAADGGACCTIVPLSREQWQHSLRYAIHAPHDAMH